MTDEDERKTVTGLTEMIPDRMIGVSIERIEDRYKTTFTVGGQRMTSVSLSLSDLKTLRKDIYDMVDTVSEVNILDRCPLCGGFVSLRPNVLPYLPIEWVGGRFVCSDCGMSIRTPKGVGREVSIQWWNSGRKQIKRTR